MERPFHGSAKKLRPELGRQVAELRGTKLLLDATFANIQDGVALLDGERQVVFANGAYADMFGFAVEELVGLSRSDFLERAATLVSVTLFVDHFKRVNDLHGHGRRGRVL